RAGGAQARGAQGADADGTRDLGPHGGTLVRRAPGASRHRRCAVPPGDVPARPRRKAVASPLVTLVDDATLRAGLRSRPFDGEGATARRNEVLTAGVFRGYLMDTYAARKTGRQTTGSA